jgi:hypothetical protein
MSLPGSSATPRKIHDDGAKKQVQEQRGQIVVTDTFVFLL